MKILIHSIRNCSHSVCLVNQFQLIELSKLNKKYEVFHDDCDHNWPDVDVGFDLIDKETINNILSANKTTHFDVQYYMSDGYHDFPECSKQYHFFVTDFGNFPESYRDHLRNLSLNGAKFITPSNWTREILIENTTMQDNIHRVPHGANKKYFYPMEKYQIQNLRSNLSINDDEIVFLNLGAMTWNKGIDILLIAFNEVFKTNPKVKLILKDSSNLYGVNSKEIIRNMCERQEIEIDIVNNIIFFSGHMTFEQLRFLYNASDYYISPYRAEGFNLPVLESLFCSTPVIVTKGGSTDDFTDKGVASYIESGFMKSDIGQYLEPSLDSLIEILKIKAKEKPKKIDNAKVIEAYSYQNITKDLIKAFLE